jgi:rhomboid protease GluP
MDPRRMCPHCRAFITVKDRVCPYCNEVVGPRAVDRDPKALLGGFIPHARFVTVMILLVNFSLYVACTLWSMKAGGRGGVFDIDGQTLWLFGAKFGPALRMGELWRLVTAGFLHGGLFHILMNSWVLFDLGAQVEEIYGQSRLIVFYFAATVLGFAASAWWSQGLSIGASAGVFGLIGAMIALGVSHRSAMGDAIRGLYVRWAVYGLIFGLLPGLQVDNAAHIGGLAAGFAIAWLAGTPRLTSNVTERLWKAASWVCLLLTGACFLLWFRWFYSVQG